MREGPTTLAKVHSILSIRNLLDAVFTHFLIAFFILFYFLYI